VYVDHAHAFYLWLPLTVLYVNSRRLCGMHLVHEAGMLIKYACRALGCHVVMCNTHATQ
jgi:hypothetical protein